MIIKKVEVRAAAALTGSNVTTNAVNVRGARSFAFQCTASNATTISVASIEVSSDGTNWVSCLLDTPTTSGKSCVVYNNTVAGVALNAGPATAIGLPFTAGNSSPAFIHDAQARLKVSTAGTVNDFAVTAFVYYDDNARIQVGEGFTPAL